MNSIVELRQSLQKIIGDNLSKLSSGFLELSTQLKASGTAPETQKNVDRLFKQLLNASQALSNEITITLEQLERNEEQLTRLHEEKRRLEALYASGILFSSQTELRSLMEKAIDVVVKELNADEGFIILTDETGKPDSIYSRNMNPEEHPEAKEMSTTVIRNAIGQSHPVQSDNATSDTFLSQQHSVIRLGIKAVLCVPLITGSTVLGAVYLDRRNNDFPFVERDLSFLLSFSRQIVRGFETSSEISALQKKLVSEVTMRFSDLRKEFSCEEIIGSSAKLFEILRVASKIAPTDAAVLLLGENGTGKDLLAHAIHRNSLRASNPFVTINCGAIPDNLLESELFGYESGAFTGAMKTKPGKLEMANGGTLFFDEVGELSVNLQSKLLRVIQSGEFERLGSVQPRQLNVRWIAATNKNLLEMIEKGSFREDLYYRMKVIELTIPSLSERREDILELATSFFKKYGNNKEYSLTPEALDILEQYSWHGNIRELENVIHRCVVLSKGTIIEVGDLPTEIVEQSSTDQITTTGKQLLAAEEEFRRLYIIKTLRQASSVAEAAKVLGINRTHFYKLLAQLRIEY